MTKKPAKAKPGSGAMYITLSRPSSRENRLFWITAIHNTAVRYLTKDGGPCWCPTYVPGIPSANHKKGTRCAITRALLNGEKGPHPFEVWKKRLSKADQEIP